MRKQRVRETPERKGWWSSKGRLGALVPAFVCLWVGCVSRILPSLSVAHSLSLPLFLSLSLFLFLCLSCSSLCFATVPSAYYWCVCVRSSRAESLSSAALVFSLSPSCQPQRSPPFYSVRMWAVLSVPVYQSAVGVFSLGVSCCLLADSSYASVVSGGQFVPVGLAGGVVCGSCRAADQLWLVAARFAGWSSLAGQFFRRQRALKTWD